MKNSNLVIPAKLKKGDTVGFVSPSAGLAPFAMHRIERASVAFQKMGYKVKIAQNALKNNGYVSAPAKERADDINQMFKDPEVKMIIATIGGDHSNQLLKYLNFNLISKNPKVFIGYSDVTVLHYAIQSQCNLSTYYGPCAMTQFGEYPDIFNYTLEYFNYELSESGYKKSHSIDPSDYWTDEVLDWFKKDDLKKPRKLEKNSGYQWLTEGKARGEILGGCVPSVNHLAGTKYWLNPEDKIYFIDIPEGDSYDKGISISKLDSFLADLDNIQLFDSIKGLIVGRAYRYSQKEITELKKVILRYAGKKNYPILFNANIGHTDPIITIRYGSEVEIDSEKNSFCVV